MWETWQRGESPRSFSVTPEPDGVTAGSSVNNNSKALPRRIPSSPPSTINADLQNAVALQRGRLAEAESVYRDILTIAPDQFDAQHLLGHQQGRNADALGLISAALQKNPNQVVALSNYGAVLNELKRFDEALAAFDKAIALKPDYADAFNNRGLCLRELKRFDEALAAFDKAIALKPDYADAFNNRGLCLRELKRFDEALASYDKAIALKPDYADAFVNRGNTLGILKRFDEALANYDKAIALKPDYADGYKNRAFARLRAGQYNEAWRDYELRWKAKDFPATRPDIAQSDWRGEDLTGRHILVFSEQGLGDVIQFCRYLPHLAERTCKTTFLAPRNLMRLLRLAMPQVDVVGTMKGVQGMDFQVALMSLPHRFNTELASIPNKVPYLKAEPELEARWKARIGARGFKIGIAWQGNPNAPVDEGRSIPLKEFVQLSRMPGVRLISLQKHDGLDQFADLPKDIEIETLGEDFDNGPDAFIDTAAVMTSLDLIITPDTSIAHLAGALGRPTWVALKHVPDWRWLLDRQDSPWYPTLRLFRQSQREDWGSVFVKIEQELRALHGRQHHVASSDPTTQHQHWWALPMNSQSARCILAKQIIEHCKIARIIETGTFFGTTTEFFAAFGLPVVTVEINRDLAARSRERLKTLKNVELRGTDSISALQELIHDRSDRSAPTLFYLDAHWEKHLPLREEVELAISHFPRAVLMIDDFKVPYDPGYGFDDYGPGKRLDIDYLRASNLPELAAYFPSTPSHREDGARRGCVVATANREIAAILDRIALLRRWTQ
jgi:tetratricopeptide (TPR) repeat protein